MSEPAEALTRRLQAMSDTLRAAALVHGLPSVRTGGPTVVPSPLVRRAAELRHEAAMLQVLAESAMVGGATSYPRTTSASVPDNVMQTVSTASDAPEAPFVSPGPAPEPRLIRKHVATPRTAPDPADDDFLVRFDHGPPSQAILHGDEHSGPPPQHAPEQGTASWVHQAVQPIVELGASAGKDFTGPSLSTFAAAVRASDIGLDELVPARVRSAPFPDEDDAWLRDAEPQADTVQVSSLDSRDYILSEPTDRLVIRPATTRRRKQPTTTVEPASPSEVQSWLRRAQERTTMAPQEAIGLYTDVLDVLPGHLDARLARARLFTDGGQLAQAASDLLRAERLAPHHPDLHHCYGDLFFRDKSYEMAIPHYSRVLRQHSNSIMALYRRGLCYYYAQNVTRAREDLQRVRALDPTLPGLETSLAQLDDAV